MNNSNKIYDCFFELKAVSRPAKNSVDALVKEHELMVELGGPTHWGGRLFYNVIYSPGKKLGEAMGLFTK